MAKGVYRRGIEDGRSMYFLGGSDLTEVSGDSVSLCKDGNCVNLDGCRTRETILMDHDAMGVVAPIMGCVYYGHRKTGQGRIKF